MKKMKSEAALVEEALRVQTVGLLSSPTKQQFFRNHGQIIIGLRGDFFPKRRRATQKCSNDRAPSNYAANSITAIDLLYPMDQGQF